MKFLRWGSGTLLKLLQLHTNFTIPNFDVSLVSCSFSLIFAKFSFMKTSYIFHLFFRRDRYRSQDRQQQSREPASNSLDQEHQFSSIARDAASLIRCEVFFLTYVL